MMYETSESRNESSQNLMFRLYDALVRQRSPLNRVQYMTAMLLSLAVLGVLTFLEQWFLPFCWRLSPAFGSAMGMILAVVVAAVVVALLAANFVLLRARLRDCREVDEARLKVEAGVLFAAMFIPVVGGFVVAYLFFARGRSAEGVEVEAASTQPFWHSLAASGDSRSR